MRSLSSLKKSSTSIRSNGSPYFFRRKWRYRRIKRRFNSRRTFLRAWTRLDACFSFKRSAKVLNCWSLSRLSHLLGAFYSCLTTFYDGLAGGLVDLAFVDFSLAPPSSPGYDSLSAKSIIISL